MRDDRSHDQPTKAEVPTAEDGADVAERVLRAANLCYAQYGVSRTTTANVARRAGLSRATVYRYFPGPRALHDAAVNLLASEIQGEVEAAGHPDQTLREFVAVFFEVLTWNLVAVRARPHSVEDRETIPWALYQANEDSTRKFIDRLLRKRLVVARERGELNPAVSDAEASEIVWIAVRHLTGIQSSPVVDLADPANVARWFTRLIFDGLGRPSE